MQVKKVGKVKQVEKEATFHQKLSSAEFPKSNKVRKYTKRLQKQAKFPLFSVNQHQLFRFSTILLGKVKSKKGYVNFPDAWLDANKKDLPSTVR